MSERERIANHLGDIGAICNDVGFAFGFYQFARLREAWQRASHEAFGHRLMMDRIVPGGVAVDLDERLRKAMRAEAAALRKQIARLMAIINDLPRSPTACAVRACSSRSSPERSAASASSGARRERLSMCAAMRPTRPMTG